MYIIQIAAEMAPIGKVGGLSDVLLGLSRQLVADGHRVEIILPKYACLDLEPLESLELSHESFAFFYAGRTHHNRTWRARLGELNLILIEPQEACGFFDRPGIYGYDDDPYRFTYFSYAALEFMRATQRQPDVVHLHDWQTALAAPLMKEHFHFSCPSVLTIHNLAYQGWCGPEVLQELGLDSGYYLRPERLEDEHHRGRLNILKGGLLYADALTTVSPRFAWEVQTPEGGFGLHGVLQTQSHKFYGILNGIDYSYWSPEENPHLPVPLPEMKTWLRRQLGMELDDRPLVACVTRLVAQKGPHLIRHAFHRTLDRGGQFIMVGSSPDPSDTETWEQLAQDYAHHLHARVILEQRERLAHQVFAAADMVLVPSLFEPCGLTQLIGLRYGAVPVVRETGGLFDTVHDVDHSGRSFEDCNGFSFADADTDGVDFALNRAFDLWWTDRERWKQLVAQGQAEDHSWARSARRYEELYAELCQPKIAAFQERRHSQLGELQQSPARRHWERVGAHDHHGICVPLSALRSERGGGIGQFTDLLPVMQWMQEVQFDTLQLLPLNDSGPDASPYNAISACALNPVYLDLDALPEGETPDCLRRLNRHKRIAYREVRQAKDAYLEDYVARQGQKLISDEQVEEFLEKEPWAWEYSLFKSVREKADRLDLSKLQSQAHKHRKRMAHHARVQLLCLEQMQQVRKAANKHGIRLMGDLPILVSADSADVQLHRQLFLRSLTAGAPPDHYNERGQKWNFPIYNWEALEADDYRWWRQRLAVAERFFDCYRLDHVIGFFRIWAIPPNKSARHGSYVPRDPGAWLEQGEQLLSLFLKSCRMLPIGEDLGVIDGSIRHCLHKLGISGTKVLRWERNWEHGGAFVDPRLFPAASLSTISTHDSESLAHWWKAYPEDAQRLAASKGWGYKEELQPEQRFDLLHETHASGSLFHINRLTEYLALDPELTWPKAEDERINVPGTVNQRNWSYRLKPTIAEWTEHPRLAEALRRLAQAGGRTERTEGIERTTPGSAV